MLVRWGEVKLPTGHYTRQARTKKPPELNFGSREKCNGMAVALTLRFPPCSFVSFIEPSQNISADGHTNLSYTLRALRTPGVAQVRDQSHTARKPGRACRAGARVADIRSDDVTSQVL